MHRHVYPSSHDSIGGSEQARLEDTMPKERSTAAGAGTGRPISRTPPVYGSSSLTSGPRGPILRGPHRLLRPCPCLLRGLHL